MGNLQAPNINSIYNFYKIIYINNNNFEYLFIDISLEEKIKIIKEASLKSKQIIYNKYNTNKVFLEKITVEWRAKDYESYSNFFI